MENLLNDEIRHQVEEAFSQLKEPVEVLFFDRQGDPELSAGQRVSGVPQTTINGGAGAVVGAVPEDYLLAEIIRSIKAS